MCWADKTAAVLAAFIVLALLVLHFIGEPAPASPHVTGLAFLALLGNVSGAVLARTVLPLWIFLRVLDLVFGGPARRRSARATAAGIDTPQPAPPPQSEIVGPDGTARPYIALPTPIAGLYELVTTALTAAIQVMVLVALAAITFTAVAFGISFLIGVPL